MSRAKLYFFVVTFLSLKKDTYSFNLNGTDKTRADIPDSYKAPTFDNHYVRPILVGSLLVISTLSVLSNALIVYVVKVNHYLHIPINYLIVNMAIGDLLATIITLPLTVKYLYHGKGWALRGLIGNITCHLTQYIFYVSLLCSIFSLVAITYDRFHAVLKPLEYKKSGRQGSKSTLIVVWAASLILPLHHVLSNVKTVIYNQHVFCVVKNSKTDAYVIMILGFALPHIIMLILYAAIASKLYLRKIPGERQHSMSKSHGTSGAKKTANKVTLMVVCILLAFDLCWAPVFFLYIGPSLKYNLFEYVEKIEGALTSKILMMFNGVSNAIIYAIFNVNFSRAFSETLLHMSSSLKRFDCFKLSSKVWDTKTVSSSVDTWTLSKRENTNVTAS